MAESSDREKVIKKNHETMVSALSLRNNQYEQNNIQINQSIIHHRTSYPESLTASKMVADQSIDIQSSMINCDRIEELSKEIEDLKIEHKKEVQGFQS